MSVKDCKFDTPLTEETSEVWFRRLRVHAETLLCADGFTDEAADGQVKRHAKFLITCNLPDNETYLLDANPTAKELFEKLQGIYAGSSYIRKAELYQRLLELRPKREKLSDFLQRSLELRAQLVGAGISDEVLFSSFFLIGLRDTTQLHDWVIQQLQTDPPKSLSELVANVRTTFRNLMEQTIVVTEPSAHTTTRPNDQARGCTYCKRTNHGILSCWKLREDQQAHDAARSQSSNRTAPSNRAGRGRGPGRGRRTASHQVQAFVAVAFNAARQNPDEFLLDTCATHHMVCDKSFLANFKPTKDSCHFADKSQNAAIEGTGTMTVINHNGKSQVLKNVLYVPSFSSNLISASQADAHGAFYSGGKGILKIHDAAGNILLQGSLRNGLYYADCKAKRYPTTSASSVQATSGDAAVLYHRRFGHMGYSSLAKMSTHNSVSNLPSADKFTAVLHDKSVCGACQEGGQKASPYPRTAPSAKETIPYAKLHVDIAGPRKPSLGGAQYFTVMRCEASHFLWVFTHKTKDESADFIQQKISSFLSEGHKVRVLRCDQDKVFLSKQMKSFLSSRSIDLQPTSGYSPQENGHAERAIGVLKERMQCLLSDAGLSDSLWAEALWHACYLQNISSSTGGVTPWEVIKGDKPDASLLRIWGCRSWQLIPNAKRYKSFDTRKSEQVRFVGIAWPNPRAYRVLTQRGRIEQTRHLKFDESPPPACDSRADFSSLLIEETPTATTQVPTVPASTASIPDPTLPTVQQPTSSIPTVVSPPDAPSSLEQSPTPAGVATLDINPLFDATTPSPLPSPYATPTPQSSPPALVSPSNIPAAPEVPSDPATPGNPTRQSTRHNKHVPPLRYHEQFISGLPRRSAKNVVFPL